MLKKRIIPIIFIKNGRVVQSKGFLRHQVLGANIEIFKRLNNWDVDEVIILDISRDKNYNLNRNDLHYENPFTFYEIINQISKHCFMPITVGGGIRDISKIEKLLNNGADKIVLNYSVMFQEKLVKDAINTYGSQCIIASIDIKKIDDSYFPMHSFGKEKIDSGILDYIKKIEDFGFGEILVNSIDNDGMGNGFDLKLAKFIVKNSKLPIIIAGGAGNEFHFEEALNIPNISGIAAGNIFNYKENSYFNIKKILFDKGLLVRKSDLIR